MKKTLAKSMDMRYNRTIAVVMNKNLVFKALTSMPLPGIATAINRVRAFFMRIIGLAPLDEGPIFDIPHASCLSRARVKKKVIVV